MRKTVWLALALTGLLASACNTVEGIGRDMQAAGRGLEKVSTEARSSDSSQATRRGPNERVSRSTDAAQPDRQLLGGGS